MKKVLHAVEVVDQNIFLNIKDKKFVENFLFFFISEKNKESEILSFDTNEKKGILYIKLKFEFLEDFFEGENIEIVFNIVGISSDLNIPFTIVFEDKNNKELFSSELFFPGPFYVKKIKKSFEINKEYLKDCFYVTLFFSSKENINWCINKIFLDVLEKKNNRKQESLSSVIVPVDKEMIFRFKNNDNSSMKYYINEIPIFLFKFPESKLKNFSCKINILSNFEEECQNEEKITIFVGFFNDNMIKNITWEDFFVKNPFLKNSQILTVKLNRESEIILKKPEEKNMFFVKLLTETEFFNISFVEIKDLKIF